MFLVSCQPPAKVESAVNAILIDHATESSQITMPDEICEQSNQKLQMAKSLCSLGPSEWDALLIDRADSIRLID